MVYIYSSLLNQHHKMSKQNKMRKHTAIRAFEEFGVAGISFKKQNVQTVLNWKKKGHQLCVNLVADPENPFDKNAIKVLVSRAEPGFPEMWIGYVPKHLTNKIKPYLSQGSSTLSEIGPFSKGYYARVSFCKKKENDRPLSGTDRLNEFGMPIHSYEADNEEWGRIREILRGE